MVRSSRSTGDFGGGGGVNFSLMPYLPAFDMFARPVTFYPYVSQPTAAAYPGRGIYNTRMIQMALLDGSMLVDQQTILDIREVEFAVLPQQLDRLTVATAPDGSNIFEFEIVSTSSNGGGETTLVLRKWLPELP
jgi:hypothetical protein